MLGFCVQGLGFGVESLEFGAGTTWQFEGLGARRPGLGVCGLESLGGLELRWSLGNSGRLGLRVSRLKFKV